MWRSGCEGEKGQLSENGREGEWSEEPNTCHLPESSTAPAHPYPHMALPDTPLSVPPSPTSLTFVTGAGGEQGGQQEGQQQEGHGVVWAGQGRARRSLAPRSLQPADSTLGEGCRGSPRRGGKTAGRRAGTEKSLQPTLVHREDLDRPQPVWLRWGTCRGFPFALEPGVLTLSLIPTPSPLLQDDVSTARRGLMGPLANRVAGGGQVLQGGRQPMGLGSRGGRLW